MNDQLSQQIHLSIFLKNLVIISCSNLFVSQTFSEIIEYPANGTYLEGADILLTCIVNGTTENIFWKDEQENIKIFIGKEKFTNEEKYQNFNISDKPGNYSLSVSNAAKSDEGLYSCNEMDTFYLSEVAVEETGLPNPTREVNGTTITNSTEKYCSKDGGDPPDATFFWIFLGIWTLINFVTSFAVAILLWTIRGRCSRGKCYRSAISQNGSTAESKSSRRIASYEETLMKITQVNPTYAVPDKHSFRKDPDLIIHGNEKETNYAEVFASNGSEKQFNR